MKRPLVYIAGPYSRPDPCINTHDAVVVAEDILETVPNVTVVIPHLSHLWHTMRPHDIDFWYQMDLDILERCDAVYRYGGESTGADNEVIHAREHGIPVFQWYQDLNFWAAEWHTKHGQPQTSTAPRA